MAITQMKWERFKTGMCLTKQLTYWSEWKHSQMHMKK